MTVNRRGFVGALLSGALTAAGATPETVASVARAAEPASGIDGDAGLLTWVLETYRPDDVARAVIDMLATSDRLDVRALKQRLQAERRRELRHSQRAARRERHAGNETLYRGPLRVVQQFAGREVRTSVRHRVLVGETDREYAIDGIGIPTRERQPVTFERDDDGLGVIVCPPPSTRSLTIPVGSRVLIDLRHGIHDVMACEVVRQRTGHVRVHLWISKSRPEDLDVDAVPALRGGLVWSGSSGPEPTVGLLGLPIGGTT